VADNPKKPGNRPVNKPAAKRKGRKSNSALWTWLAVGIVVAIVATVVLIKTTEGPSKAGASELVSSTVFNQVTKIPASVYNAVGITTSSVVQSLPPTVKTGEKPLYFIEDGKKVPGGFYWGAEYCPYCAATRWAIIAAYSRFGTFDKLYTMTSAPAPEVAPNTPTFTFYGVTYHSPQNYTAFRSYEVVGPINNGTTLETPPAYINAIVHKYNPKGYFPFLDVGNKVFYIGTAYDPNALGGATREQIAANLSNPNNVITQAIVATSNYISAGICATNGAKPGSVCHSSGVQAAARALHLTF
jgi:Domain of unknown function (DUF929)